MVTWMAWDKLAQYSIVATMEWFDWLPIFGEPLSQSFVSQEVLNDRFFSLISFSHATFPLFVLFLLWIHIMRISKPVVNPRRRLALGMLLAMLVLSLVKPAVSQGPADMGIEPRNIGIDWFYLFIHPLLDVWSAGQSGHLLSDSACCWRIAVAAIQIQANTDCRNQPQELQRMQALRRRLSL